MNAMQQRTVLVIEDHRPNLLVLKGHLQGAGYRVVGATSGHHGVETARAGGIDVITLDLQMKPMDGWQVLQMLRADAATRDIPVVLVTIADPLAAPVASAVGYVAKPFKGKDLLAAVERAMITAQPSGRP